MQWEKILIINLETKTSMLFMIIPRESPVYPRFRRYI